MLVPAVLLALFVAAPIAGPMAPSAVRAVPDEPDTVVLPDAAILQAVVADLDGDGRREIVRLVRADDDAALAEVWGQRGEGWRLLGPPVEVVPPSLIGTRIDPVYQATPIRLLVRRVGDVEHLTVASQPHFEEIDVGPACCLLLHDLVLSGNVARRVSIAEPGDFADTVLVVDLDGDGTDELLTTRSLPPEGDIGYPTEARVHRWTDSAFAAPTYTELPIGSGDAPFLLGDSDGVPGDEAAIVSTLGPSGLFRIRLAPDDRLAVDRAGFVADQVVAVPLGEGRGVAAIGPIIGLIVAEWPAGAPSAVVTAEGPLSDGRLLGPVNIDGLPTVVVYQADSASVNLLELPGLVRPQHASIGNPAAATMARVPLRPFVGRLPGGGADGEPSLIISGRLIPALSRADEAGAAPMATLAGAQPIGLVGDRDVLVIGHAPVGPAMPGPGGGALVDVGPIPLAWTSIAPLGLARQPEADGGELEPALRNAMRIEAPDGLAVGPAGFMAEVAAPPGSRVVTVGSDSPVPSAPRAVPANGRLEVPFVPPEGAGPNPRYRASLAVSTPAGHGYVARWDVHVLTEAPPLDARVSTPFGSLAVEINGLTSQYATVRVNGHPVEVSAEGRFATAVELPPWPTDVQVEATDFGGNLAQATISGVGWFDYRELPWVPIVVTLVAAAALILFLRVPHTSSPPRRAGDDGALEELEPD